MKRIYKLHHSGKGLVDITDEARSVPESTSPAVFGDIEPYQFMGESPYGKFDHVNSRSKHKELLRLGGYTEVGSEKPSRLRERERNG